MRRRMSNKAVDAVTVVRYYAPDLARQTEALLAVLGRREAQPPAEEGPVEAREPETTRESAPAAGTNGAQDQTSAVTIGPKQHHPSMCEA